MSEPTPPAAFPTTHQRRRLLPGARVLLVLGLVVVMVMSLGWLALRFSTGVMENQPPLSWSERAQWPQRPVRETTLSASGVRTLISGDRWRELSLTVPAAEEHAVAELATLAQSEAFADDATRQRIEAILGDHPGHFYANHLLGTWHRVHGDDERADDLYERAFADAPGALRQLYATADYRGLARLDVGTLEVICYRADGERVDDSLRLVYPELITDEQGYIAVPVYPSVYSIARRDEPTGLLAHHAEPDVFAFPGRLGTLPTARVDQRP